ncbi:Alpha-1,3-mannosyltransferase cmt1 [Gnomoniopsis smithogilvyi]|uniref:Alpha-1,3-mannosyltransferase cmt1 n=1 Tax=Gnomoniopsis smithogilvyi TaxID=1191159 RepID=A0A9W8YNA9_9PEZI|nr:Alpha-1,3-mannosyltransferase cmt1 [Gnomoniopsis smithogilvyi]
MARRNISSWFSSSSSSRDEAETKRLNRRSFAGFSAASHPFSKTKMSNGLNGQTTPNNTGDKPTVVLAKAERPSTSSTTQASEAVAPASGPDDSISMTALAEKISRETAKLEKYMKDNNLPMPTFGVDAADDFPRLPNEIQKSRLEIIHATKLLRDLTVGPREGVRWGVQDFLDVLALEIINNYGLAKLVPLDQPIALTDLEKLTPLDPVNLARTLRMAMVSHIFTEPTPGVIAHTAASRLLATDDELAAWVGFNSEDIFPAAGHVMPALRAYPEATSLTRAGFQHAFNTVDVEPMFATFGKDAVRARRMGRAMASLTGGEGYEMSHFVEACDLKEVDARGGTFVDVGGSHGFMCVELAKKWPNMRFVVQDLPKTVESAPRPEDEKIAERVEFKAHDFFGKQDVVGDVYYFRWIMHNYSTPYAVSILQNLIPSLKPGARIIINDHCLREPGQENAWDELIMRRMDMVMLTLLNAQERTEAEFKELFRLADTRFEFKGVTRTDTCRMSIVEAVWRPEESGAAQEVSD